MAAQQIIISSDKNRVTVSPGAQTELGVTIQNLTALVDNVSVTVGGIDPAWALIVPANIPIFAQGEASVRVIFQPPANPRLALAGSYPLRLLGSLQEQNSGQAEARAELEIQFGGDYHIELGQATSSDIQEAVFPFQITNEANAPLNIRCSGEDPQNAFWYKFDPFQFTVPPGGQTTTTLTIRARHPSQDNKKIVFTLITQGEWTISGMTPIEAALKQINGQWEQAALTALAVAVNPYQSGHTDSALYQVVVSNPGPTAETVFLEGGTAAQGQLLFRFNPVQLTAAPKGQASATLTVWPAAAGLAGQPPVDFWVTAKSSGGKTRPASCQASFFLPAPVPRKERPGWVIPLIVLGVALILICVISGLILVYFRNQNNFLGTGSNGSFLDSTRVFARSVFDGSIRFYFN